MTQSYNNKMTFTPPHRQKNGMYRRLGSWFLSARLTLSNIYQSILKRSKLQNNKKNLTTWLAKGYQVEPLVSIIIQSHNKSLQVLHIVSKFRQHPNVEIIVIDDGSDSVHTRRLAHSLTGANEFLLRCNDLYEVATYDRAIRFASGKYVALLQDDDDYEADGSWINTAVKLFKQHPRMCILGGKDGVDITFDDVVHRAYSAKQMVTGNDFQFSVAVNRAPMWINRELFMKHLGHIAPEFMPFQYDDYELCCRAWTKDLQVGWYDSRVRSLSAGGMRIWNTAFTHEQALRNGKLLYDLYRGSIDEIR